MQHYCSIVHSLLLASSDKCFLRVILLLLTLLARLLWKGVQYISSKAKVQTGGVVDACIPTEGGREKVRLLHVSIELQQF